MIRRNIYWIIFLPLSSFGGFVQLQLNGQKGGGRGLLVAWRRKNVFLILLYTLQQRIRDGFVKIAVEGIKSSLFNQNYNIIFAKEAYIYFLEGSSPPGVLIAVVYFQS